jgi:hypothetical protein
VDGRVTARFDRRVIRRLAYARLLMANYAVEHPALSQLNHDRNGNYQSKISRANFFAYRVIRFDGSRPDV